MQDAESKGAAGPEDASTASKPMPSPPSTSMDGVSVCVSSGVQLRCAVSWMVSRWVILIDVWAQLVVMLLHVSMCYPCVAYIENIKVLHLHAHVHKNVVHVTSKPTY